MNEEVLLAWLLGVIDFWLGICGSIVSFWAVCGAFAFLFYVVCRYLVCENDLNQWEEMKADMRSGMRDVARTFRDVMPGVHAVAKQWAGEKVGKKERYDE